MHAFHCLNHSITLSLFQSILSHFFYLSVSLSLHLFRVFVSLEDVRAVGEVKLVGNMSADKFVNRPHTTHHSLARCCRADTVV